MVPINILLRVFHLKCGSWVGTGFAMDVEDRQYIVTATHLLEDVEIDDTSRSIQAFISESAIEILDVAVRTATLLAPRARQ